MANPWDKVQKAGDMTHQQKMKMLIYGRSGTSKTTLAAKFSRPLIGVTEHQAIPAIQETNPEAMIFPIEDYAALEEFRLMVHHKQVPEKFDAVVLDSLTDAQRLINHHYVSQQRQQDSVEMNTWGKIKNASSDLARSLRDLPVHVCLICLEEEAQVDDVLIHRPVIEPKKLQGAVAQFFNLVGYTYTRKFGKEIRYDVLFKSDERFITKGMSGLDIIEPPEPLWWSHKRFGTEVSDEVKARVKTWKALGEKND